MRRAPFLVVALVLGGIAACHRSPAVGRDAALGGTGSAGTSGAADGAGDTDARPASDASDDPDVGPAGPAAPADLDPGWTGLRRLTDAEYDNTMRDLLGLGDATRAAFGHAAFPTDTVIDGFDNAAEGLGMSAARFQWTFSSAVALIDQVFADDALRKRIVTCAPASPTDTTCARAIVRAFGLRAWRRPLSDAEVDDLSALVGTGSASADDFAAGLKNALVAMLVSESFLYRIERDPDPNAADVHSLSGYELATRLSYLLWSSMPDDTLFGLAARGELFDEGTLRAQALRLLADDRAEGFVRNFAGQWLGFRALEGARFERAPMEVWTDALQAQVATEARLYVGMILAEDRALPELLSADVNFVDEGLALLYGLELPPGAAASVRLDGATDGRRGFIGLAAPLALTSKVASTSPTLRGRWVLDTLLCADVPSCPGAFPAPPGTPRQQAAALAARADCAGCHAPMDAIGLGLENFDQVGRFRVKYDAELALIDPSGALPDGTPFNDVGELGDLVGADPRFPRCAERRALAYALGRRLAPTDDAALARIEGAFTAGGLKLRALLAGVVTDGVFRFRRGEGTP